MHQHHIIHDDATDFQIKPSTSEYACGYDFRSSTQIQSYHPLVLNLDQLHKIDSLSGKGIAQSTGKDLSFEESLEAESNYISIQSLLKKYNELEHNYKEHKIDEAYMLAAEYKKLCKQSGASISNEQTKILTRIQDQMSDVLYYQQIINQDGWKLGKEKKDLKVSTKIDGGTVGVLVEANLEVPVQYFLTVLTEVDLVKNYMPFMAESKQEKLVSRNCRIGHCINDFPFISKRESFFQGIGYDRMDFNRTVLLYTRSLNQRPDLQQILDYKVETTPGAIQLDYKYFVMEYRPNGPSKGSIKLAINIDMKLKIPMFLLLAGTQNFGEDFYKNILKIAKNFKGSIWQEKVNKNPAFFNLVRRRIQELFSPQKKSLQ